MPAVVRWHLVSVTTLADGGDIKDYGLRLCSC